MKFALLRSWKDPKTGARLVPGDVVSVAADLGKKMLARGVAEALAVAKEELEEILEPEDEPIKPKRPAPKKSRAKKAE